MRGFFGSNCVLGLAVIKSGHGVFCASRVWESVWLFHEFAFACWTVPSVVKHLMMAVLDFDEDSKELDALSERRVPETELQPPA